MQSLEQGFLNLFWHAFARVFHREGDKLPVGAGRHGQHHAALGFVVVDGVVHQVVQHLAHAVGVGTHAHGGVLARAHLQTDAQVVGANLVQGTHRLHQILNFKLRVGQGQGTFLDFGQVQQAIHQMQHLQTVLQNDFGGELDHRFAGAAVDVLGVAHDAVQGGAQVV